MMFCGRCGHSLTEDALYCEQCGAKIPAKSNHPSNAAVESTPLYGVPPTAFSYGQKSEDELPNTPAPPMSTGSAVGSATGSATGLATSLTTASTTGLATSASTGISPSAAYGQNAAVPPPAPRWQRRALIAAIIVVFLSIIGLFFMQSRGFFYLSLLNSGRVYKKEAQLFVDKNPVLSTAKAHLAQSFALYIRQGAGKYSLKNDAEAHVLALHTDAFYIMLGSDLELFFTEEKIIGGISGQPYLMSDANALGDDLLTLSPQLQSLAASFLCSQLGNLLKGYDFSYSSIMGGNVQKQPEKDQLKKDITKLATQFIRRAQFEKSAGTAIIGGENVQTQHVTLTADAKVLAAWAKDDLLAAAKSNEALARHLFLLSFFFRPTLPAPIQNASELLKSMESGLRDLETNRRQYPLSFVAEFDIYRGVVVDASLHLRADTLDKTLKLSGLGAPYHLNDFQIAYLDGDETVLALAAKGEHIDTPIFRSDIVTVRNGQRNEMQLSWKLTHDANNLSARADGQSIDATFALTDGDNVFHYDSETESFHCKLTSLDANIIVPDQAIALKNLGSLIH